MKALIDSDIFCYAHGSATDSEYKPLMWPFVQARLQGQIDRILEDTGANEYQLFLTSDDKSNFRYSRATIQPYKGNRKTDKPFWYGRIRDFLVDHRGAVVIHGREADDAIAEAQYEDWIAASEEWGCTQEEDRYSLGPIICSLDKDLDMVPGWHYKWPHGNVPAKGPYFVSELEGMANFYCQCLTGDSVDNIPGLFGVGKSSKLLARVRDCSNSYDMYCIVREEYRKRFGSYADQFLKENADLLWLKRSQFDEWTPPTQ